MKENAKKELLRVMNNTLHTYDDIRCAVISIGFDYQNKLDFEEYNEHKDRGESWGRYLVLKDGYADSELSDFMKELDVEYDSGFGGQELYGYVVMRDGSWLERNEYDGSEWWEYRKYFIPEQCRTDK